jgi:predicted signal transduction protein with EAL and GGDEF domain
VARLGGDEFAVICEDSDGAQAATVAARVQDCLNQPFDLDGEPVYISASIGIALSPPYAVGDLLRFADAAMYDAKAGGRSQVNTFEGGESSESQRRLAIVGALREALGQESLTLGYQAIVDLESGAVTGLEALLRWTHPTLGFVDPAELVRAADSSGLSFELDRAVIRRAGVDLLALRSAGLVGDDIVMSVNISSRTAQEQRLDTLVREMLEATGLPARCLVLEITEHALMDNAEHAVTLLTALTDSGVGVAIDDFGTGYNSLVHLQRLPVSVLKIDRSFVQDIASRPDSLAIVRSILGLAAALGLEVIAEGVEDREQVRVLLELGCRSGQGFLWGPAVLVDALPDALAAWTATL